MGLSMTLTASDPSATSIQLLADGDPVGPWGLDGWDHGDATVEVAWAGARGTLGPLPASTGGHQARTVRVALSLWPSDMQDSTVKIASLMRVLRLIQDHGGRFTTRRTGQSRQQHIRVLTGGATIQEWRPQGELDGRTSLALTFTCAPFVEGDSMRVTDRFTTDTEDDYTLDTGSSANLTVGAGVMTGGGAGEFVAVHTATGHQYGDHQATGRFQVGQITTALCGVVFKRVAATTRLQAVVYDDGAATTLYLEQIVSGVKTTLSSVALTRLTTARPFHVTGRIEGNIAYAEYWAPGNHPTLGGSATNAVSAVLTGTGRTNLGEGTTGQAGVWFVSQVAAADQVMGLDIRPYVYRGANLTGRTLPEVIRLDGAIPGDSPALAEWEIGVGPGGGVPNEVARFGLVAWSETPPPHQLLHDGSWETVDDVPQWSTAAVTGITAAGTSITRVTGSARHGASCGQAVLPATNGAGVTHAIYRTFRAGVTYTAVAWLRSAGNTTTTRVMLGVNGDVASSTATALTTGWVQYTVTWTPTTTRSMAYLAVGITAATATTIQIDEARVYEGTIQPTSPSQDGGAGGRPLFGVIDAVDRVSSQGTVDLAAGSSYLNGRRLTFAATTLGGGDYMLDPNLLPPDPLSDSTAVEVWLAAYVPVAVQTTIKTELRSTSSTITLVQYTAEYGSAGLTITPGSPGNQHLFRLGTIVVPRSPGGVAAPMILRVTQTYAAAQTFHWAWLLLVPAGQRACSPTGVDDVTGYPTFASTGASTWMTRQFTTDLRGTSQAPGSPVVVAAPCLEGPVLTPSPGPISVVAVATTSIPGINNTLGGLDSHRAGAVAVTPTPRWVYWRDA